MKPPTLPFKEFSCNSNTSLVWLLIKLKVRGFLIIFFSSVVSDVMKQRIVSLNFKKETWESLAAQVFKTKNFVVLLECGL